MLYLSRSAIRTAALVLSTCVFATACRAQDVPPQDVPPPDEPPGPRRVVVISDIGNEPDDQMSFVRFLLYSNEFQVEAMIAATSTWQKTATHPETMHALIAAYAQVLPHLRENAGGWPPAGELDRRVFAGQPAYGLAATGPGKDSPGAQAIITAADSNDPRPLWICIWGGANTLAQALLSVRAHRSPEQLAALVSRLRVYSISDQDDAGPWIRGEFPGLYYIVQPSMPNGEAYAYATWTGISGDRYYRNGLGADFTTVTNEWLDTHIRKGPLGALYPRFAFIMEGDTPSFLNLIDNGLAAWQRPDWGGWGGRYLYLQPYGETHRVWTQGGDEFLRVTSQDTVTGIDGREYTSDQATIWRWREAFQDDFAARIGWTISGFAQANHNPVVVVNGQGGTAPIHIDAAVGEPVVLDAAGSRDPDQGQTLHYHWFLYPEAGSAGNNSSGVELTGAETARATATPAAVCREPWLPGLVPCKGSGTAHILLAVTDDGTPRLTSYRRVILTVRPKPARPGG